MASVAEAEKGKERLAEEVVGTGVEAVADEKVNLRLLIKMPPCALPRTSQGWLRSIAR